MCIFNVPFPHFFHIVVKIDPDFYLAMGEGVKRSPMTRLMTFQVITQCHSLNTCQRPRPKIFEKVTRRTDEIKNIPIYTPCNLHAAAITNCSSYSNLACLVFCNHLNNLLICMVFCSGLSNLLCWSLIHFEPAVPTLQERPV